MTGFAYDGAEYDGASWDDDAPEGGYLAESPYDGAHWDESVASGRRWRIGNFLLRVQDVVLTPRSLTLDVRARSDAERRALRVLDNNAGKVQQRERADGTVVVKDTSGGSNTYEVEPPSRLRPPRIVRDWLVDDVERERTSADTQATTATVSFLAAETRSPQTGHADAAVADAWELQFTGGTIITRRVSRIQQGATTTVQAILTPRQAELFESVTAATAGADVGEVPDGESFASDETPTGRQTVTVSTPADATDPALAAGTYVLSEWTVQGSSGGGFRADISVNTRFQD